MRRRLTFAILLSTLGVSLFAQLSPFGGAERQKPLVKLTGSLQPADGGVTGEVIAAIDPTWHINSHTPLDEFLIPTVLEIQAPGLSAVEIRYPAHVERDFSFATGKVAVYEGTVSIPFTAKGDAKSVRVVLRYQACNDTVCLPPTEAEAVLGAPGAVVPTSGRGDFTPLSSAPAQQGFFGTDIGAMLASRGLLLTLLSVFVVGIALNLTPCVYPLIPITLAYFSSQSEGKRSRRAALSLAYVAGIAVTYSILGVFAALTGGLFGAWLQHPGVLVFFALLMLVLAASMFGAYEIRVPHFITDRSGAKGGMVGALVMGLLVGIVAAPCVGPVVISLIAVVSQSGNAVLGFVLFFVLALGLGLPYLIGVNALPRSGVWMEHVKKAMGFILVAVAFYFLRPLLGDEVYKWGAGISLLVGAIFLFVVGRSVAAGRTVRVVCAVLLLVGGAWFLWPRAQHPGVQWTPYQERLVSQAASSGKPVIIDFYADWCLPCKELDEKTFTKAGVIADSDRFVRLKADLTSTGDASVTALAAKYRVVGVPTIVFLDAAGREREDLRLTGFENAERFLARMKAVR